MNTVMDSRTTTRDGFLRFALRLDAGTCAALGVVNAAIAPQMSELAGTALATEYALSAFFFVYGVAVYGLSMPRHVRTLGVAAAIGNVVYAVAMVAVVVAGVWPLTTAGVVLTLGSGVFTLVMADLQYLGLRRMRARTRARGFRACGAGAG